MNNILTRKVTLEDRKIIWEWWNDPQTRKMMKLNKFVPWEDHIKWFENTINSTKRILLISLENDKKIGVVRFDYKEEDIYEVSINLNPDFRGMGYGSKILRSSLNYFINITEPKELFAMFKKINIASKQTFLNCGFEVIKNPNKYKIGLERFDLNTEDYCQINYSKRK